MYFADRGSWYLERGIWLVAGLVTLAATALAVLHSPYWLLLNAAVGINLLLFAGTGFCLMANLLVAVGLKPRCSAPVNLPAER